MMKNCILEDLQNKVKIAWQSIPDFEECILLDTPEHTDNIGSMALLFATVYAVSEIKKARILYSASKSNCFWEKIHSFPKTTPVIIRGGNLGNFFWKLPSGAGSRKQCQFIANIIQRCQERRIILIPQTVYFDNEKDSENLARAIHAHPEINLMVREKESLSTATRLFPNCKIILSPDIVFLLHSLIQIPDKRISHQKILYLKRQDWENPWKDMMQKLSVTTSDWIKNRYIQRLSFDSLKLEYAITKIVESFLPKNKSYLCLDSLQEKQIFRYNMSKFYINRLALQRINHGIHQTLQYSLILTNRLHGHIFSTLLGIPNIALPSPYDKIQSCYDSWTQEIPYCKLALSPENLLEFLR